MTGSYSTTRSMENKRAEKIRDLKNKIITEQSVIEKMIGDLNVNAELELSDEERTKRQEDFKTNMALKRAEITGLKEELKLTRLNKYGSSFFEWHPHKGMNRRQARAFRKSQR